MIDMTHLCAALFEGMHSLLACSALMHTCCRATKMDMINVTRENSSLSFHLRSLSLITAEIFQPPSGENCSGLSFPAEFSLN